MLQQQEKAEKYFKIMKSVAQAEVEYSKINQEFWEFVGTHGSLANV